MSKFGVIVMGPAGVGKTTFCSALYAHLRNNRRSAIYINLDPAAESFVEEPDVDIRDLISLEDVMEDMDLGPNGGLIYCFEYLLQNLEFLTEPLETVTEEYLIIIDMPGQIELYTHVPLVPQLVGHLQRGTLNINLCAAYLLESTFTVDKAKFFAGTLSAMSAMIMLELPHINILSKMDLIKGKLPKRELKRFINADAELLNEEYTPETVEWDDEQMSDAPPYPDEESAEPSFKTLNRAVGRLIDDYSMVSFLQLDVQDEDSLSGILSYIDDTIQYHEAQEPKEPMEEDE